jgi:hypothetical protein
MVEAAPSVGTDGNSIIARPNVVTPQVNDIIFRQIWQMWPIGLRKVFEVDGASGYRSGTGASVDHGEYGPRRLVIGRSALVRFEDADGVNDQQRSMRRARLRAHDLFLPTIQPLSPAAISMAGSSQLMTPNARKPTEDGSCIHFVWCCHQVEPAAMTGAADENSEHAFLIRTDAARNIDRFYVVDDRPTLFGEWAVLREVGPAGLARYPAPRQLQASR